MKSQENRVSLFLAAFLAAALFLDLAIAVLKLCKG